MTLCILAKYSSFPAAYCFTCKSNVFEEDILLCDGCDVEYHRRCLTVPLAVTPEGSWYCIDCLTDQLFGDDFDRHFAPAPSAAVRALDQPSPESSAGESATHGTASTAGATTAGPLPPAISSSRNPEAAACETGSAASFRHAAGDSAEAGSAQNGTHGGASGPSGILELQHRNGLHGN